MADPAATRRAPGRHPVRTGYLSILAALALSALVVGLAARGSEAAKLLFVFTCLAALPLAFWAVRWVWRKLTYRVGVRLFISYLLIGLTPIALFACLTLLVGYLLVGQYGTVRMRHRLALQGERYASAAADALRELAGKGPEAAVAHLRSSHEGHELAPEWVVADGGREWRSDGARGLPAPRWAPEGSWQGFVVAGDVAYDAVIRREGARLVAVLVPMNVANARAFAQGQWFDVRWFSTKPRVGAPKGGDLQVSIHKDTPVGPTTLRVAGQVVPADQVEPGWLNRRAEGPSWWQRLQFLWVWFAETPHLLQNGTADTGRHLIVLIKVRVAGAVDDFFGSPKALGGEVTTFFRVLGTVFGSIYVVALGFAVVMILAVTRATARLTRGARAVGRGDLEHRIPVKKPDQLGDLAVSFNAMTESVKTMLVQVAEKERMAREMELAREIQSSLLPPSELSSGPLSVWAHFRPAAEVGGDYFDLFPLAPGHLSVAIGDVAGHGLPTGLLMAMVKSAVATLVEEGYHGGELLLRLNHLLLGQSLKQRMVSFALAEIDTERREVKISSAGHQPGVVLAADGGAEEVLLSSLPLGHRWPDPPPTKTLPFGPGSRLVLYSDGLVEGRNADGVPFGHGGLRDALLANREVPARALVGILLAELERHLGGQPLADDLTHQVVAYRAPTP
ncbi:MAG: PP2C family protein-serine/threonine phosphatase [Myxococcaceae bacterium]